MSHTLALQPTQMASTETGHRVSINLPVIDEKPSLVRDGGANKKRPTSGGAFPRMRKFSYESPEALKQRERGFVLDCVALSRQTNEEIGRSQPSVDIGIPQYNALSDKHARCYFKSKGLPATVTSPEVRSLFEYLMRYQTPLT